MPKFQLPESRPAQGPVAESNRRQSWRFHFGTQAPQAQPNPLYPAAVRALQSSAAAFENFPLLVNRQGGQVAVTNLNEVFQRALQALTSAGQVTPVLDANRHYLLATAAEAVGYGKLDWVEAIDVMRKRLPEILDLSESAKSSLDTELNAFLAQLPREGTLYGMCESLWLDLYLAALEQDRREHHEAYRAKVKRLLTRMEELLLVNHSKAESTGDLNNALGGLGGQFVDAHKLISQLPAKKGSKSLDAERLTRLESVLGILREFAASESPVPEVIYDHELPTALESDNTRKSTDLVATALQRFEQQADKLLPLFKAVRKAQLEVESAYEPSIHDEVLNHLRWRDCQPDELNLSPAIVIYTSTGSLHDHRLSDLTRLFSSNYPIHVLVRDVPASDPQSIGRSPRASVSYLAMAHHETFVLQASLARPNHLISGLRAMIKSRTTGIANVACPKWNQEHSPWLQLEIALRTRINPLFTFDPSAGRSMARRFSLIGNPEPESQWTCLEIETDSEVELDLALTPAVWYALDGANAVHFMTLDGSQWAEEQVSLDEYLSDEDPSQPKLPFIWILNGDRLTRALVSQALATECLYRQQYWQNIQELAGIHNDYAIEAAEIARDEAMDQSRREIEALKQAHADALSELEEQTARNTMQRLARSLLNLDHSKLHVPVKSVEPIPVTQPETQSEPPTPQDDRPAPEPPPPEEVAFTEDPYIDAELCTSCDECINLNPQMFRYNADRQAQIADATAGTFKQLVMAAEQCPARCIHPGSPRAGDQTATDELRERAKAFQS